MTTKRFCSQTALVYTLTVLIIILEIHKIPGIEEHSIIAKKI